MSGWATKKLGPQTEPFLGLDHFRSGHLCWDFGMLQPWPPYLQVQPRGFEGSKPWFLKVQPPFWSIFGRDSRDDLCLPVVRRSYTVARRMRHRSLVSANSMQPRGAPSCWESSALHAAVPSRSVYIVHLGSSAPQDLLLRFFCLPKCSGKELMAVTMPRKLLENWLNSLQLKPWNQLFPCSYKRGYNWLTDLYIYILCVYIYIYVLCICVYIYMIKDRNCCSSFQPSALSPKTVWT